MSVAEISVAEEARLRVLASLDASDGQLAATFDSIVQVASTICVTPIALVSLVERERVVFLAGQGLELGPVPHHHSLCNHAIRTPQMMLEVADASVDPRFADYPLVTGAPGIRFYAGVPLVTEGEAIGTLCVIDRQPRVLNESQRVALDCLAQVTVELFEARRRELALRRQLAALEPRNNGATAMLASD